MLPRRAASSASTATSTTPPLACAASARRCALNASFSGGEGKSSSFLSALSCARVAPFICTSSAPSARPSAWHDEWMVDRSESVVSAAQGTSVARVAAVNAA